MLQLSCAYYNTFYNAKDYYKKGREASDKNVSTVISKAEITNYNITVEKCESVILKFPNSRYVDDALLLMSKSQYYLGEFDKSKLNLEELVRRFPESSLKDEALLWLGRSAWKLGQFSLAKEEITEVLSSTEDKKLLSSGNEMLAEIYRDRKDDKNEIKYLRDVIKYTENNQQKAETYYRIGLILIKQENYPEAIASFQKVEAQLPSPELLEKAKMENTRALKHMGNTTEALDILQTMHDSELFKEILGEIKLEIAEIALITGDVEGAIEHFGTIAITYPLSEVAMRAWYKLAELHTYSISGSNSFINYPFGMEYFRRAEKALKGGYYHTVSLQNKNMIEGFLKSVDNVDKDRIELIWLSGDKDKAAELLHRFNLKQSELLDGILPAKLLKKPSNDPSENTDDNSEKEISDEDRLLQQQLFTELTEFEQKDLISTNQEKILSDSLASKFLDKVNRDSTKLDSIELIEANTVVEKKSISPFGKRIENVVLRELIYNEYLMAEFYQLDLIQPDSAISIFEHILTKYSDSEFAPRSALSLGILYSETNKELADSMFNLILTKYSKSPSTIEVNRRMKNSFSKSNISVNPESDLYEEAYNNAFIEKNNRVTLELVEIIENKYPNSYFAAKAAYLRAYMIDHSNDTPETSLKEYNRVIENYSDSDFAKEARIRVARLKRIIVKPENIEVDEDEPSKNQPKKSKQLIKR